MRWSRPLFDGMFDLEMHGATVVADKLFVFGGLNVLGDLSDELFFLNTGTFSFLLLFFSPSLLPPFFFFFSF